METATLNVGSGRDTWGDIRIDMTRSQTGVHNNPNVIASALHIPLRTGIISEIRCRHVIEHIGDWKRVVAEIARVSSLGCRVELRFPIDDGYKRDFMLSWSRVDVSGMIHAYYTRKNRAHSWIMNPKSVSVLLTSLGFTVEWRPNHRNLLFPFWVFLPRWRKILPGKLRDPKTVEKIQGWSVHFPSFNYEWVLNGVRTN